MWENCIVMKKSAFLSLLLVAVSASSCGGNITFVAPAEYRFKSGPVENSLLISEETYFIVRLTQYVHHDEEGGSFINQKRTSDEKGHWYLNGKDYLMDLEWKNCAFETMSSFTPSGWDDGTNILGGADGSARVRAEKQPDSSMNVEITFHPFDPSKKETFVFAQIVE